LLRPFLFLFFIDSLEKLPIIMRGEPVAARKYNLKLPLEISLRHPLPRMVFQIARRMGKAVGDVACQPGEEESGEKAGENCTGDTVQNLVETQAATALQIENMKPDRVALLEDEQYQVGQYSDFENSYEQSYGAFKLITRPAPGNHEFYTEHGAIGVAGYGYFSYFNGVQHNTDGSIMTATPPLCPLPPA
jgi:hypothetical protein